MAGETHRVIGDRAIYYGGRKYRPNTKCTPPSESLHWLLERGHVEPLGGGSTAEATGPNVTPAAERLIAEHGLDAAEITGTGAGGKIVAGDVEAYVAALLGPEAEGEWEWEEGDEDEAVDEAEDESDDGPEVSP